MATHRAIVIAACLLALAQSSCGTASTAPVSDASLTPSLAPPTSPSPSPEAASWPVGEPADSPLRLDPLPPDLVGDVGPLGASVYWGGELSAGAEEMPGIIFGYLDGSHRLLIDPGNSPRWDGTPIVSVSRRGVVLLTVQRQSVWGLQIVDVASGEVRQIVEVGGELWDAVIHPDGSAAYWLVGGDSPTGGVWRMDLASGEIDRVLEPDPVARTGGNVLAAAVRPLGQLAVSDGRLAVLECYHDCRLRLLNLANGSYRDYPAPAYTGQELLGFAPGGIAFSGGCVLLPSGTIRERRCTDPTGAVAALKSQVAMGFHVELPDGWMLRVEPVPDAPIMTFEMTAVAVSTETGDRVPLRVLGTLHGQ
jgi:hypothetical protein